MKERSQPIELHLNYFLGFFKILYDIYGILWLLNHRILIMKKICYKQLPQTLHSCVQRMSSCGLSFWKLSPLIMQFYII